MHISNFLQKICIWLSTFLSFCYFALAGGIDIHRDTFIVNNSIHQPFNVNLHEYLRFEFMADQYIYGRPGDKGYIIFVLESKSSYRMKNSVGNDKFNHKDDILFVMNLLEKKDFYKGPLNGRWNSELETAIISYQKSIGFKRPDGVVEKDGLTYKSFVQGTNIVFLTPLRRGESNILYRLKSRHRAKDLLLEGNYCVKYARFPIYHSDLRYYLDDLPWREELFLVQDRLKGDVLRFMQKSPIAELGYIRFLSEKAVKRAALYLKANNQIPVTGNLRIVQDSQKPIEFSWFTKGDFDKKSLIFRYRLLPDKEWSMWTKRSKKLFYYISKGSRTFEVEGKYFDSDMGWMELPPAMCTLNIGDRPFIAKPEGIIYKATSSSYEEFFIKKGDINLMYRKKYALLIGIENFSDSKFSPLIYMKNDLKLIQRALKSNNFEVDIRVGDLNDDVVVSSIQENLKKLEQDDILLIYISSHGFSNYNDGYIACSNCVRDTGNGCLELEKLEDMVKIKNHKGRHILIILDSCSAGLGLLRKDVFFPERDMVFKRGVIMFTAGLENQAALMVTNLKSSVFTFYLAKGLEGEADIIKDGFITVTELMLFVRYNVAKYTNGMQIPMMGRLSGSGEMVFPGKLESK